MYGNGLQDKKFVTEWGASLRWAHRQREHGRKKKGEDVGATVPLIQCILISGKILLLRIIESKKQGCR